MVVTEHVDVLEEQIARWRAYLRRRPAIRAVDVEELEDHLRGQLASLADAGLAADEAFLVAVKRVGDLNALSREFAHEYSERLWKQLVVGPGATEEFGGAGRTDTLVVFGLAMAAALAVKVPELLGYELNGDDAEFYLRNFSLFVLPLLTGYLVLVSLTVGGGTVSPCKTDAYAIIGTWRRSQAPFLV